MHTFYNYILRCMTACGFTARMSRVYTFLLRCMTAQLVFFLRAATTPPHYTRKVYRKKMSMLLSKRLRPEKALHV